MKGIWIAAVAAVGITSAAWATTSVPVTFDARLTGDERMELRVTSNSEFVTRGALEVQQGTSDRNGSRMLFVDEDVPVANDVQSIPMTLVPGAPVVVFVDVHPDVEEVVVRYFMESGTAAAVDVIHLGRDSTGSRRVVSPSEQEHERAAQTEAVAERGRGARA